MVIMRDPPGVPVASQGLSSLKTIVGVMELKGRLSPSIALASPPTRPNAFGTPGLEEKSSISLFNRIPVPAATIPVP